MTENAPPPVDVRVQAPPSRDAEDQPSPSLRQVTGRGAVASVGIEVGGRALALLLSLATARILGPRETGILGLAVLVSGLASFLGALPEVAGVAAPRNQHRDDGSWALAAFLLRGILLALMGLAFVGLALFAYPHMSLRTTASAPRLLWLTALLLLIPAFEWLNTIPQVLLQRQLNLAPTIRAQGVQYVVSCGAGLAALFSGWGIEGIAAASVLGAACASLALWARARHTLGSVRRADQTQFRSLVAGTGRVAVGHVGGYVALRIDNVLVAASLGATAMGLYAMAWNASRLAFQILARPVTVALLPALASIQDDKARMARGVREALTLVLIVLGGCSAMLAVSAPRLVALVLGPKWAPIVPSLRLMALTAFISALVPIGSALTTAVGRAHLQLWPSVLGIVCFLVLMPPIAVRYGILGASFVDLLAASSATLVTYLLARRVLPDVNWWSAREAVPVLAALGGGLAAWVVGPAFALPSHRLVVEVGVLGVAYLGLLRLLGGRTAIASLFDLGQRILASTRGERTPFQREQPDGTGPARQ